MKILDIPQSGKRGLNVSQAGQFGQISRALAIPSNPRTPSQMGVRTILSRVAARWRVLEEAQRAAWMAAAKEAKSNTRLGQNGTLSGFLLASPRLGAGRNCLRPVSTRAGVPRSACPRQPTRVNGNMAFSASARYSPALLLSWRRNDTNLV
jgi:hypothetical protein